MYTIDGLRSFSDPGTHLGVVGFPIAHSISPVFQNAALRELAEEFSEFGDWDYLKIEASVENLPEVVQIAKERHFSGLNLTLPHKVDVLPILDHIDPIARKMGAVNTLVFEPDGIVVGHNTDGYGMSAAIRQQLGVNVAGRPVMVLGAGGASRAACVQCLEEGCSELWVGNRSEIRLKELLQLVQNAYPDRRVEGFQLGKNVAMPSVGTGALLINATSLGLKPEDPSPVNPEVLGNIEACFDMVYGQHTSTLLKMARDAGIACSDGLSMLVLQGARSLELWTGKPAPLDVMFQSVRDHMNLPNE